jgi:hypothetical protein
LAYGYASSRSRGRHRVCCVSSRDVTRRSRGAFAPELSCRLPSKSRGRGECRVKASPMARQRQEKLAAVTTGSADHPAFPARWFTAYTRSPRGPACLPPYVHDAFASARHQHRDARTPRLRRPSQARSSHAPSTSTAPRPHARDDRPKRPSSMRRDGQIIVAICPTVQADNFESRP